MSEFRFAYLHGFASSPEGTKALYLRERFAEFGVELERPDLNAPSFSELRPSACLAVLDQMASQHPDAKWCLIGSSFGGYLSALWASRNPTRVAKLVLLCPGLDMPTRWRENMGDEALAQWESVGTHEFWHPSGMQAVGYGLYQEMSNLPTRPVLSHPTVLIHGEQDEVVPYESSRRYADEYPQWAQLKTVQDNHRLSESVAFVGEQALIHFHDELQGVS